MLTKSCNMVDYEDEHDRWDKIDLYREKALLKSPLHYSFCI